VRVCVLKAGSWAELQSRCCKPREGPGADAGNVADAASIYVSGADGVALACGRLFAAADASGSQADCPADGASTRQSACAAPGGFVGRLAMEMSALRTPAEMVLLWRTAVVVRPHSPLPPFWGLLFLVGQVRGSSLKTIREQFALFGMQNRAFESCLMAHSSVGNS
jgi:hypothetical protein